MKRFSLSAIIALLTIFLFTPLATATAVTAESWELGEIEKAVVAELNKVRTNPKAYAEENIKPIKTDAGVECYQELVTTKPGKPFAISRGMSLSARDHVNDQAETGATGHSSKDGSTPFDRMAKYGK